MGVVGRLVKFNKEAKFVTADDDVPIDENAEFIALCDETLVGWIKFFNDGTTPPARIMGALYDGFMPPRRETLGDLDQAEWPSRAFGRTRKTFGNIKTRGVAAHADARTLHVCNHVDHWPHKRGKLVRHYNRTRKTHPDELPVVRLRAGGFNSKKPGVGWVSVPVFAVVGRAPRDSAAQAGHQCCRRSQRSNSVLRSRTVKYEEDIAEVLEELERKIAAARKKILELAARDCYRPLFQRRYNLIGEKFGRLAGYRARQRSLPRPWPVALCVRLRDGKSRSPGQPH